MVLATGKPRHSASVAKRKLLQKSYKDKFWLNRSAVPTERETYTESKQAVGWDEDTCRRLDKIAREDWSYIATSGGGVIIIGSWPYTHKVEPAPGEQDLITLTLSERSET